MSSQANFTGADLQEANLTAADLRGVIWKNARLEKLILRDAKVSSPTWLSDLSNLALATGIEDLLSRYYIDALAPQSDLKGTFFLIKERPGLQ
ncbi:MAG: pentapeptide repeat-containing protein [Haliscomenobacter sp.]|nr:pentapeptide repeat-containing protein [Haliscomenobacter sp.]